MHTGDVVVTLGETDDPPLATPERRPLGLQTLLGVIERIKTPGVTDKVGSVRIDVTPVDSTHMGSLMNGWRGDIAYLYKADALLEFDFVRIEPQHRGRRHGLWLVAEALAELSRGRRCLALIVAEPLGWENLSVVDRERALRVLDGHWARLGFEGGILGPNLPGARFMWMEAHDYLPPMIHESGGVPL